QTLPPDLVGLYPLELCERYRELTGLGIDVVNPETLAYFMVLGTIAGPLHLLPEIARLARGESQGILPSFWPRAVAMLQRSCMIAAHRTLSTQGLAREESV